jgi:hypothetical protein
MEKLIILLQNAGEEMGAVARAVIGFLIPIGIAIGLLVLHWIRGGGMAPGNTKRFFAEQRENAHWRRDE